MDAIDYWRHIASVAGAGATMFILWSITVWMFGLLLVMFSHSEVNRDRGETMMDFAAPVFLVSASTCLTSFVVIGAAALAS